jgi:hypothetical protein
MTPEAVARVASRFGEADIQILESEIVRHQRNGSPALPRPWPGPDLVPADIPRWSQLLSSEDPVTQERLEFVLWQFLSDQRLLVHVNFVYLAALATYLQIAQAWLPALKGHLAMCLMDPLAVEGVVSVPARAQPESTMQVAYLLRPLARNENRYTDFKFGDPTEFQKDVLTRGNTLLQEFLSLRPGSRDRLGVHMRVELSAFGRRPLSKIVRQWLNADLFDVHWAVQVGPAYEAPPELIEKTAEGYRFNLTEENLI